MPLLSALVQAHHHGDLSTLAWHGAFTFVPHVQGIQTGHKFSCSACHRFSTSLMRPYRPKQSASTVCSPTTTYSFWEVVICHVRHHSSSVHKATKTQKLCNQRMQFSGDVTDNQRLRRSNLSARALSRGYTVTAIITSTDTQTQGHFIARYANSFPTMQIAALHDVAPHLYLRRHRGVRIHSQTSTF